MKLFLIQRNLPNAGKLTMNERIAIAKRSCAVINELGHENLKWNHSYITSDNLWCIYNAKDEEILREHARRGQFPCNNILEIHGTFSPATAELVLEENDSVK